MASMRTAGAFLVPVLLLAGVGCDASRGPSAASGSAVDGRTPTASSPRAPSSAPVTPDSGASLAATWPTYHRDNTRRGFADLGPKPAKLRVSWRRSLDGAAYGSPLVLGRHVVAATENDTVYRLGLTSGAVEWRTHLGAPVPQGALPCGDIDPLGITGTPAVDPATGSVFVVAEFRDPIRQELFALDAGTGRIRWHRSIDLPGMDPRVEQQRAALAVANHRVYVALGGLAGDCGDYHGYVIGVPTSGTGPLVSYRTPSAREAGIWATSGPAVDSAGNVYVSVGNGAATGGRYDDSDAVLKLSPALRQLALFAPTRWAQDNAVDLDLGSTGPVLLADGYLLAAGKSGTVYLVHPGHLGGVGGAAATLDGCRAYGGSAAHGSIAYLPCTSGVMAVDTSGFRLRRLWQQPGIAGSPVSTPGAVWTLSPGAGVLYALAPDSGHPLGHVDVGTATRFASPALAPGLVLVPTTAGVVAVAGG